MERKLGRYELLRRIAAGGMGEIYLARARGAGGFEKMVIIKTILPHLAEEEEFITKFLDEGRIVVQLTHGNIVPVFDMGEEDGEFFIAMEYVPGLDLRAVLKGLAERGEEMPVEISLYIASEISKGLGYAHRKVDPQGLPLNIVHRDVSPSNVLISFEGEVKIIDFGIARAAGKLSKTANGAIQGKCCYMSPEQARGQSLDARSDVFSTAVLLYEMLTLVRPFEGRSDLESLELVRSCQVDPPGVLRSEISDELDRIILKALHPDPDERYPDIDAFYIDLQHEIYRLGHTVTSLQIVDALQTVLKAPPSDEAAAVKPANLDEALELELARLGGSDAAPSHRSGDSFQRKISLASTATDSRTGTRTIAPTPAAGLKATPSSQTSHPTPTTHPEPLNEEDSLSSSEPISALHSLDEEPRAHFWRKGAEPLLVTLVFAMIIWGAYAFFFSPSEGTLSLETAPPGAQIFLDGEELVGRRTPATLTLPPGNYSVELALEEHRPRRFRVDLSRGESVLLGPDELQMILIPPPPRTFSVSSDHPDASITADGETLDSLPADLTLEPGDIVNLVASAPGCASAYYTLTYNHQRSEIPLSLSCQNGNGIENNDTAARLEAPHRNRSAAKAQTRFRRILIDSEPAGAEIVVDNEVIGHSPVYARLREDRQAIIEARRDGFLPQRSITRIRDLQDDRLQLTLTERPQGCLNFRAIYPANNQIAINGVWLDGRHMSLREHSLPAGANSITVRHPESGKEETFQIQIDPGSDCKVLTVWER